MSRIPRCYVTDIPLHDGAVFNLDRSESHHIARVMRCRPGDSVQAMDGRGTVATAEIIRPDALHTELRLCDWQRFEVPPTPVTLALAYCKGKVMETVLRKGVELGIHAFHPVISERCEARPSGGRGLNKLESWEGVAIEAMKQSGNPYLPMLHPPQDLTAFLDTFTAPPTADLRLLAGFPPRAKPLRTSLGTPAPSRACWLIGPEGGFSPAELDAIQARGFCPVTLGPYTLRAETAAVAALAALNQIMGSI